MASGAGSKAWAGVTNNKTIGDELYDMHAQTGLTGYGEFTMGLSDRHWSDITGLGKCGLPC